MINIAFVSRLQPLMIKLLRNSTIILSLEVTTMLLLDTLFCYYSDVSKLMQLFPNVIATRQTFSFFSNSHKLRS